MACGRIQDLLGIVITGAFGIGAFGAVDTLFRKRLTTFDQPRDTRVMTVDLPMLLINGFTTFLIYLVSFGVQNQCIKNTIYAVTGLGVISTVYLNVSNVTDELKALFLISVFGGSVYIFNKRLNGVKQA